MGKSIGYKLLSAINNTSQKSRKKTSQTQLGFWIPCRKRKMPIVFLCGGVRKDVIMKDITTTDLVHLALLSLTLQRLEKRDAAGKLSACTQGYLACVVKAVAGRTNPCSAKEQIGIIRGAIDKSESVADINEIIQQLKNNGFELVTKEQIGAEMRAAAERIERLTGDGEFDGDRIIAAGQYLSDCESAG